VNLIDYCKSMLEHGNVPLPRSDVNKLDRWHNADTLKKIAKRVEAKKQVAT
jgi:hypothetical protein